MMMMMNKKRKFKFDEKEEERLRNTRRRSEYHHLCDDIVLEILTRLPVRSLIRFTCVSKSWNSMIKNPKFIAAHKKQQRRLDHRYLLHIPAYHRKSIPLVTTFFFKSESSSSEHQQLLQQRSRSVKLPFDDNYRVFGSCEGLACVVNIESKVYLYDPLLQTFKIVPPSPSELTNPIKCSVWIGRNNVQLGLGYYTSPDDGDDDDYRIVKIVYNNGFSETSCLSNKVEIYSMKSDSWKTLDCAAPGMVLPRSGVFINGCIKWLAAPPTGPRRFTIVCFDIDKESFGESLIEFPPHHILTSLPKPPATLSHAKDVLPNYFINTNPPIPPPPTPTKEEELLINCSSSRRADDSLWRIKTLSCENSWVSLIWEDHAGGQRKLMDATTFDGTTTLLDTTCQNLITFLGFNVGTLEPWEEENLVTESHIVSMSESFALLDHPNQLVQRKKDKFERWLFFDQGKMVHIPEG